MQAERSSIPTLSRRQYLTASSMLASGALLNRSPLSAADPIGGRREPKFKFSLAAYSYRTLLQGKGGDDPAMDLHGFIDECAAMGLEGSELTSYYMPEKPSESYLIGLRNHCFRQGLAVSGTAIRNDFGHPAGEQREREIAHVCRWVDHAATLHAPMIRIFAGHHKKGTSAEDSHRLMVDGMQQCCEYAGKHGIYLALENHGGPTASAEGLLRLVRDVQSPWLAVNLDTGNFREGGDPYAQMKAAAPYAVNVQVKVALKGRDGQKTEMDFAKLRDILQASNYRGFIVLEYEEAGDVPSECRRYVNELREVMLG